MTATHYRSASAAGQTACGLKSFGRHLVARDRDATCATCRTAAKAGLERRRRPRTGPKSRPLSLKAEIARRKRFAAKQKRDPVGRFR